MVKKVKDVKVKVDPKLGKPNDGERDLGFGRRIKVKIR